MLTMIQGTEVTGGTCSTQVDRDSLRKFIQAGWLDASQRYEIADDRLRRMARELANTDDEKVASHLVSDMAEEQHARAAAALDRMIAQRLLDWLQ